MTSPSGGSGGGSSSSSSSSTSRMPGPRLTKWWTGAHKSIYGRHLLDALRGIAATGGGAEAVRAAADSALALTAHGQTRRTRWSRFIELFGNIQRPLLRDNVQRGEVNLRRTTNIILDVDEEDNRRGSPGLGRHRFSSVYSDLIPRFRKLGRLIPGCRRLPVLALLEEAADYVEALQMQVEVMRALADALKDAHLSSPSLPVNTELSA